MNRRWGHYGAGLAGIGLLVLTGCVPGRVSKGPSEPAAMPAARPEVKASAQESSPQANAPASDKQGLTPSAIPPEPSGYRLSQDDPLLAERLSLFEKKKGEWYSTGSQLAALTTGDAWPNSWQECLQDIELALTGYRELQAGKERGLNPLTPLGRELHYYDKGCDQVLALAQAKLAPPSPQPATTPLPPIDADNPVRRSYEAGQYQEVITAYEAQVKGQGVSSLPRGVKEYACRALVKLGRFAEAARLLTELLQETGPPADLSAIEFRILTADVLSAVGQINEAREVYEGVSKALAAVLPLQGWASANAQAFAEPANDQDYALYQEVLQTYLRFDGQQVPPALLDGVMKLQKRPPSPLLDLAKILQTKAIAQSQAWVRTQLVEIRALIDRRELGPARKLVEQLSAMAPSEMQASITALQGEITQAEAAAAQTPPATPGGAVSTDPWAEAQQLFEQQKYDEAISAYQQLLTGERGVEAQAKISEATDLAATALRRQAAALYTKARNTFDPEAKRQTLQSSRNLLVELIEKYPGASIITKARQNLKVLDSELGQAGLTVPPPPNPAGTNTSPR